jgi:hypothetical protein
MLGRQTSLWLSAHDEPGYDFVKLPG